MLCDELQGWDGGSGRREAHEGGHVHMPIAHSDCCMAETNTALESNYIPTKNKLKTKKILSLDFRYPPVLQQTSSYAEALRYVVHTRVWWATVYGVAKSQIQLSD